MRFIVIFLLVINAACNSAKNATKTINNSQEQLEANRVSKRMLDEGIDFVAEGTEPSFWKLTINYDDTARFVSADGLALKIAFNQLKKTTSVDKIIFTGTKKEGTIVISIFNKSCSIPTQKEVYTKEVTFLFNTILYKGCGKFLVSDLLNGKWELEKIGNELINKNDYKQIPIFIFNINKINLNGNDGCNNFFGEVEVVGKRIQFYDLIFDKKNCSKKSIIDIINKKIKSQLVDYYFKNGKLYLYLIDDSILVFKKI